MTEIKRENRQNLIEVIEETAVFVGGEFDGEEIHTVTLKIGGMEVEVSSHSPDPHAGNISVFRLGENRLTVFDKVTKKSTKGTIGVWTTIRKKEE